MTLNAEAFDPQRFRRAGGFEKPMVRRRSAAGLSAYGYVATTQRYLMDNGLPLTTERLTLRRMAPADASALFAIYGNEENARFEFAAAWTMEQVDDLISPRTETQLNVQVRHHGVHHRNRRRRCFGPAV